MTAKPADKVNTVPNATVLEVAKAGTIDAVVAAFKISFDLADMDKNQG